MDSATEAVLSVARGVLEELDLEVVLARVLEAARGLSNARYAALGVLDESRNELTRFLTLGIDEHTRSTIGPLPTGRGVLGELIRNRRPLRIADVGTHPYSYGFPVGHPPMSSFLGVPIVVRGEPYGNLYLTEKQDATEFSEADERSVMLLADFAGLAIDHAQRYSGSESDRRRLEQTNLALDATIQIARALGGETDLQAILEMVAKRGRALVSARVLIIELLDADRLTLAAGAGELPAGLVGQNVSLANTVASAALRGGQTQRLSEGLNRARFEQHGIGQLGLSFEDGLVVPLVFRDHSYGVLVALDHHGEGDFTVEHERLLEAFAASAATAVATARSAADERLGQRIAATEAERGRWARELHDETLQALGTLRLVLSGARRSDDPAVLAGAVDRAVEQLEVDITSLRALITELRPAALDQLGLEPALLALADRVRRAGLEVDCHVELAYDGGQASERLVDELEVGVYRIVQEALSNAVKHGEAAHARVEVLERDDRVSVLVSDDGRGFHPSAPTAGFGLMGMRERSDLLGGRLAVDSTPAGGTTVTASFPMARRHRESDRPARPLASEG
jgi:two-component system, NarL family, sensor histidine kinase DevS